MNKLLVILLFLLPVPLFASQIWTSSGVCDGTVCGQTAVGAGTEVEFTLELADGTSLSSFTFDKSNFISLTAILDPLGAAITHNFAFDNSSINSFGWEADVDYLFIQQPNGMQFCSSPSGSSCSDIFGPDGFVEWSTDNRTGLPLVGNIALDWQLQSAPVPVTTTAPLVSLPVLIAMFIGLFGSGLIVLSGAAKRK